MSPTDRKKLKLLSCLRNEIETLYCLFISNSVLQMNCQLYNNSANPSIPFEPNLTHLSSNCILSHPRDKIGTPVCLFISFDSDKTA